MKSYWFEYIGFVVLFIFILMLVGMFGYQLGYEACAKDCNIFLNLD